MEASAAPSAEKVARHLEKTRLGVLRFLVERGGQSTLAEMHDHSERRYFIAHRKFSDLMEQLIESGVIDYDTAESKATITPRGREEAGPVNAGL